MCCLHDPGSCAQKTVHLQRLGKLLWLCPLSELGVTVFRAGDLLCWCAASNSALSLLHCLLRAFSAEALAVLELQPVQSCPTSPCGSILQAAGPWQSDGTVALAAVISRVRSHALVQAALRPTLEAPLLVLPASVLPAACNIDASNICRRGVALSPPPCSRMPVAAGCRHHRGQVCG